MYRHVVTVLAALIVGVAGQGGGMQHVAASDARVWVQVESTTPGVGCSVAVAFEVHEAGGPAAGVSVSLALDVGGDVIATDAGTTNADGIAHLAFEISGTDPRPDGWLDANVAGSYVGGLPIQITADGPCDGNETLFDATVGLAGGSAGTTTTGPSTESGTAIWVPTYHQQRNLSCEYASLTIATAAFGSGVPEDIFVDLVGSSDNPHWGFRGNIDGAWGNTEDYGVYAEALVGPLAQFGFTGEVFYGEGDASTLTTRLDAGEPVVVWLGLWGDQSHYESAADGTQYKLTAGYHVVVAYGYDARGVWVSDPGIGDDRFFDWESFLSIWNVLDGMALAVTPS